MKSVRYEWKIDENELDQELIESGVYLFRDRGYKIFIKKGPSDFNKFTFAIQTFGDTTNDTDIIVSLRIVHPKGPYYSIIIPYYAKFGIDLMENECKTAININELVDRELFIGEYITIEIFFYLKDPISHLLKIHKSYSTKEIISLLKDTNDINNSHIKWLISSVSLQNIRQKCTISLNNNIIIIGTIRSFVDFFIIFQRYGIPDFQRFLYIGNVPDLKTLLVLLCLCVSYPNNFHVLRWTESVEEDSENYKIKRKYLSILYSSIPIVAEIDNAIYIAHGGISHEFRAIDSIRFSDLPCMNKVTHDVVLSSPKKEIEWYLDEDNQTYFGKSALEAFIRESKYSTYIVSKNTEYVGIKPFGISQPIISIPTGQVLKISENMEISNASLPPSTKALIDRLEKTNLAKIFPNCI